MRNTNKLSILILFLVIVSCKYNDETPKVAYNKTDKTVVNQLDTTKILAADLPIQFEGTRFLIYPIGNINIADGGISKYDSSSKIDGQGFTISNNMDNEITGYLQNLKFQNIDSDSLTVLTDKPILLESTTYLRNFANKKKQQILVHLLADNDSNDDGKLDTNDIRSLYLSDISGGRFTKISINFQEIINWKIIESQNRLYFKSIEDTNKNGQFDKKDKLHYSFVNLLEKDWKAVEINPI